MTRSELLFSAAVTLVASSLAAVIGAHVGRAGYRSDNLTTRTLTVVDASNRPVAVLSSNQGSPELAFFDQQHRKRSALFLEPNGTPDLYLYDAAGTGRASFDLYDSGAPNLAFVGTAAGVNKPALLLESTSDGNVRLAFRDFQKNGAPVLGTLQFSLVGDRPKLELRDATGKSLWTAP